MKADFNQVHFVEIDENQDGQRLDNFLIRYLKGVPKTHIYRIIRKGEVRINKSRAKQVTRLKEKDLVRIPPIRVAQRGDKEIDTGKFEFLEKAILFEDEALIVLNKPSGMAVHSGSGIAVGIIEAMRALRGEKQYLDLAHRLDRETSGCLVIAKKASVLKHLNEQFSQSSGNKRLKKEYLCLLEGFWRGGARRVQKALDVNNRKGGERHVLVSKNGSDALSIFTPLSVNKKASLLKVDLITGRTHQVRVHALSEGHPVLGDSKYGNVSTIELGKEFGLKRLFLHAHKFSFTHPLSKSKVAIQAPLPRDLLDVLKAAKLGMEN